MISVSDAWKDIHQRFLLSEGHIDIRYTVPETDAQENARASGANEAYFSNVGEILDTETTLISRKYATNELNLWALDGTCNILPDSAPYEDVGYTSDISESGSVTVSLPAVHSVAVPGITIIWSNGYGEYPPVFTVTAKNGDTVVAETTVTENTQQKCYVDLPFSNYDSVTVTVLNWCVPYRRARIEEVGLGHVFALGKKDILSYTHEQYGNLLSGELPKTSIDFTVDNIDGRWNPNNPTGIGVYLSERQKVTVRYGFTIDDKIEWIRAGVFYMSEWNAPSNGIEARFVARDIFEYLLNEPYKGVSAGNLENIILSAFSSVDLPDNFEYVFHPTALKEAYTVINPEQEYTCAEVIQMCANIAKLVIYQDRYGRLHIDDLDMDLVDYLVPISLSYNHPEVNLLKPLRSVSVDYITADEEGNDTTERYILDVASVGEIQTVTNPLVRGLDGATSMAEWVRDTLLSRKEVSGEYRADPRLDLFDVVAVESKYGKLSPVVITDIKYTFNGSFRGSYTGRVIEGVQA